MIVNTFTPKYMKSFKCIGSKCTDTCCAGWDINIDEDTFLRYTNSTGELRKIVEGKYIASKKEKDFFNAAYMILKEKSRCPFLNEKMLCDIHGNIGEENLCITCKNYPRVFNIIDDVYEKSALTSCEEVCTLALGTKEKIEFIEAQEDIDENSIEIRRIIDTEVFQGTDSLLQYFWEIRVASINIMQCRNYTIVERLGILKGVYESISALKENKDFEAIEEILDEFNEEVVDYEKYITEITTVDNTFIKMISDEQLINDIRSNRLREYAERYKQKISSKNIINNDELDKLLSKYDYIIENYIVNQIFKDLIPFNKGEDIIKSVNTLINTYKLIIEYIRGGVIIASDGVSPKDIMGVIKAVSKDIEHNKVFIKVLNYKV